MNQRSASEIRSAIRAGKFQGPTSGLAPGHVQVFERDRDPMKRSAITAATQFWIGLARLLPSERLETSTVGERGRTDVIAAVRVVSREAVALEHRRKSGRARLDQEVLGTLFRERFLGALFRERFVVKSVLGPADDTPHREQ